MMVGESWDVFAKRGMLYRHYCRYHVWKPRRYHGLF